jgi:hypothetical protein
MKRIVVFAAFVALISSCGLDNPLDPNNPSPAALTGVPFSSTIAKLSWTSCPDADFYSYTLFRSASAGISGNPGAASVLIIISVNTTTTYKDENLQPGSTWYYVLKTTNDAGNTSWSNEVSVKLPSKVFTAHKPAV